MTPTVEQLRNAINRFSVTDSESSRTWLCFAEGLHAHGRNAAIYLVTQLEGEGHQKLTLIHFAYARELFSEAQQADIAARLPHKLVSFSEVLSRPCLECGAPALIVGEDSWRHAFDPMWLSKAPLSRS